MGASAGIIMAVGSLLISPTNCISAVSQNAKPFDSNAAAYWRSIPE